MTRPTQHFFFSLFELRPARFCLPLGFDPSPGNVIYQIECVFLIYPRILTLLQAMWDNLLLAPASACTGSNLVRPSQSPHLETGAVFGSDTICNDPVHPTYFCPLWAPTHLQENVICQMEWAFLIYFMIWTLLQAMWDNLRLAPTSARTGSNLVRPSQRRTHAAH